MIVLLFIRPIVLIAIHVAQLLKVPVKPYIALFYCTVLYQTIALCGFPKKISSILVRLVKLGENDNLFFPIKCIVV